MSILGVKYNIYIYIYTTYHRDFKLFLYIYIYRLTVLLFTVLLYKMGGSCLSILSWLISGLKAYTNLHIHFRFSCKSIKPTTLLFVFHV